MTTQREIIEGEHDRALDAARKARVATATFAKGYGDAKEAMSQLAEAFHSLEGAPGVRPWDPEALCKHARSAAATSATHAAAALVLSVWNNHGDWGIPGHPHGFDLQRAYGCWDHLNRAAFVAWAEDPWWP